MSALSLCSRHLLFAGCLTLLIGLVGCGGLTPTPPAPTPPSDDLAQLATADRALAAGQVAVARPIYESLTAPAHPSSIRGSAALGLGRLALKAQNVELALRHLGEARSLLRRHPRWAHAELLYGDARIRAGHLQSGVDSLTSASTYLVDERDRKRAAYLITKTTEALGLTPPPQFAHLAKGARFPEYDAVFARYEVKPKPITPRPTPARPAKATSTIARKMISRKDWKARPTLPNVVKNRRWTRITIHHTADQGSMVSLGDDDTAGYLRRLQNYFQETKKYADLPYHYLISKDGKTYEGRPLSYQGAHAGGSANRENIGVALIGNFESVAPTKPQLRALQSLITTLMSKHKIAKSRIYPHCDLKETRCPGAMLEHTVRTLYGHNPQVHSDGALCEHHHHAPDPATPASAEAITD